MQKQWTGKSINWTLLSQHIEEFLKGRGFETKKEESAKAYTILGTLRHPRALRVQVAVRIQGVSNDFVIDFSVGEGGRSSIKFGFLTTVIGGGGFILRGLKMQEELEKLEEEFWMYIEEVIARLVSSASPHM